MLGLIIVIIMMINNSFAISQPLINIPSEGYVQGNRAILLIENPGRRSDIATIGIRVNGCQAIELGKLEAANKTLYMAEAILSCKLTPGSYVMEIEFVDGVAIAVRATVFLKQVESTAR